MAAVKIVVKNVYKPAQALELAVDRGATVRSLKQLIERDFPEHPAVADQKLIFGGKICADGDALSAVLAQQVQNEDGDDDEVVAVVFHLLVASTMPKPGTPPPAAPVAVNSEAVEEDSAAVDSPRPGAERTAPSFADPDMFAPPTTAPTTQPAQPAQPAPTTQHELYRQMMLMQQQAMVLTQIQYLQQLQQQAVNAAPAPPAAAGFGGHFMPFMPFGHFMGGQVPHFPAHHGHDANAPAAGGAAPPAPGLAAMFGAAGVPVPQAAAAVPRGPPPMVVVMLREVLPLFEIRLALKMAFMLFLIGQDTPTDRVLMLGLLSFISYLYVGSSDCNLLDGLCILTGCVLAYSDILPAFSRKSTKSISSTTAATVRPKTLLRQNPRTANSLPPLELSAHRAKASA